VNVSLSPGHSLTNVTIWGFGSTAVTRWPTVPPFVPNPNREGLSSFPRAPALPPRGYFFCRRVGFGVVSTDRPRRTCCFFLNSQCGPQMTPLTPVSLPFGHLLPSAIWLVVFLFFSIPRFPRRILSTVNPSVVTNPRSTL